MTRAWIGIWGVLNLFFQAAAERSGVGGVFGCHSLRCLKMRMHFQAAQANLESRDVLFKNRSSPAPG
jgi:hypothetical protein